MLLNALLFPRIERYSVKQVEYSEFLSMLEEGKIQEVQMDETQISFIPTEQEEDGRVIYYTTNRVTADDKIVDRLIDAGVEFGQVVPEAVSYTHLEHDDLPVHRGIPCHAGGADQPADERYPAHLLVV